jgi:two-component system, OmpR family, sensor histidine kinase BaeS
VRIPIFTKLFMSLFVTSLLLVIGMTFLVSYNFKTGFQDYFNQVEQQQVAKLADLLTSYYSLDDGWQALHEQPEILADAFTQLGMPPPAPFRPGMEPHNPDEIEWLSPISQRIYLADEQHHWVLGKRPSVDKTDHLLQREIPIDINNHTVGWLVLQQQSHLDGPVIERFYEQQQSTLFWTVALAGLASLIVALLLVGRFLAPLKHLKQGASSLSQGNYKYQFNNHSNDEFGELAEGFQYLADSLQRHKETREQWITDISHELRTPIAVLRSELEAIQDGIRQPTHQNINSMHHQVIGLGRLIDDLYQLSKSDSGVYQMETNLIHIQPLLQGVAARFTHRADEKGLSIELVKHAQPIFIMGDEKMLEQLFVNVLENSLRYTDSPGMIRWSLSVSEQQVVLQFEDSSPCVDDVHLPKLFDRLYRVDKSRSRLHGGSGLGLSICKNIVVMHQGKIRAAPSSLGGIMIEVTLNRPA